MEEMVYGQNVIGQNGTNKTVPIKSSINLSIRLSLTIMIFFVNPASSVTTLRFHLNYNLSRNLLPFCPYYVARTILSIPFCPYTILSIPLILSVPFCPLPFCPVADNLVRRIIRWCLTYIVTIAVVITKIRRFIQAPSVASLF